MSQSSASRCIAEVVEALNEPSVFNHWVHFPETSQEMNEIVRDFYRTNGFPGVIGCIDCTHVAIVPPAATQYDEKSYINRKHYHSINTQLICDANLKILNVNARFPGGTHDCHIWNNSNVLTFMEHLHRIGKTNYHLIGDSGYPLRPWCLTPIREAVEDSPEALYSDVLKQTRSVIERCNGVLKGRFRCLIKDRVLHYTPNKASKIINACTVLHNMCIVNNLEHPDYSDLDNEQLGIIRERLPELPAPRNRINVNLVQGRAKQAQIVNSYFNH